MANVIETEVVSTVIKSSAEKFYNFFKFNITDIVKILPAVFTGAQVVEGVQGAAGCVILWSYNLGGSSLSVKMKAEVVDDGEKSIKYVAVEGDVLEIYKSFGAKLDVNEGLAKLSIEYEKATPIAPSPDLYASVAATVFTLLDDYLLVN
ncbi:hypothetical protein C2S51_003068 [Perilla frutescens var. frutescens]|nr:hypothetical protein C2S51_003068 [Perilla frutescens var. frutescens]